jgi:hypothetical protein
VIDFGTTTAFRLVRRLATGEGSTAMYLLVHQEGERIAIESDLQAEAEVQLGVRSPIGLASDLIHDPGSLKSDNINPIHLVRIDRPSRELIALLDTHVVRLERSAAQFVFLATDRISEKLLASAPNFRSRVTDVLRILPDNPEEAH